MMSHFTCPCYCLMSALTFQVTAWNQTQPGTWLVPVTINMCSNLSTYYLQPNNTLEIPLCKNREYFLNVNKTGEKQSTFFPFINCYKEVIILFLNVSYAITTSLKRALLLF